MVSSFHLFNYLFKGIPTSYWLFNAKIGFFNKYVFNKYIFSVHFLHIVESFQLFLTNTNNLYTIAQFYGFNYMFNYMFKLTTPILKYHLFAQFYGFKYFHQTSIICKPSYSFK